MGTLYLQDGTMLSGKSIGASGASVAEIVFNTAMTGYQEILTDPSYAGQIVNMTYPLIGNYGIDLKVNESTKTHLKGFLVKSMSTLASNFTSEMPLGVFLKENSIVTLEGIDTRKITKCIRRQPSLLAVISSEDLDRDTCETLIRQYQRPADLVSLVSRKKKEIIEGVGPHVAVMDFGIKDSIVSQLTKAGCKVTLYPYDTTAEEILSENPDGILLSNGPGDPLDISFVMETIRKLITCKPVMGICLGHQLLALTMGAKTYKLKFGHHGGNHGVLDLTLDKCFITSQNHEFAVEKESLAGTDLVITHVNLNDGTVEGIRHEELPVFSVQFHPEAAPGPVDNSYLFAGFLRMMAGEHDYYQALAGEFEEKTAV